MKLLSLAKRIARRISKLRHRHPRHIPITELLVQQHVFAEHPLQVMDVGCSGGISPQWRAFEPSLRVLGVDPLITEIDRLKEQEESPNIHYLNAYVGLPPNSDVMIGQGDHDPIGANPWNRLSAGLAVRILRAKLPEKERLSTLNDWQRLPMTTNQSRIGIDRLAKSEGLTGLDFIKIDVDGDDLNVLLSAEKIIHSSPVIGLMLEVNFFGSDSRFDHTFHNTDRMMRRWGFELFDLTVRKYSSAALPARFTHDIPSETQFGRPYQGDALYLRDPLGRHVTTGTSCPNLDTHKLLKLACLFQCFGLPDHAAEVISNHVEVIAKVCDPKRLLDELTKSVCHDSNDYSEYVGRFHRNPTSFYSR